MRQFVFGLLVAALVWWGYGKYATADQVFASNPATGTYKAGEGDAAAASIDGNAVDRLLQGDPSGRRAPALDATSRGGDAATTGVPQVAAVPHVSAEALRSALANGDGAARRTAWAALATNRVDDRAAVVAALWPAADDPAAMLAALGDDNSFLHSAEGRSAIERLQRAIDALPDAEAMAAGSRLLTLMMRGRLENEDLAARGVVDACYRQHRIRVDRWLCDPANLTAARSYVVQRGDSLARIAGRFRKENLAVEDGTLAVLNRIHNPNAIQVGQKLKVPVAPIVGVLEKRSFTFAIYVGEHLLRLYRVGHGKHDGTPVTEFTVAEKQPQPQWTAPDGNVYPYGHPSNILGEYFVKFTHASYSGFGAHGTPQPETIGTMSSAGCIRMYADDIAELFRILPRGALVVVRATESLRG